LLGVGMEEGKRAEARRHRLAPFWEGMGEAGRRWGTRNRADTWRKRGTSRGGGPCQPAGGARPAAAQNWRAQATCAMRVLSAEQRGWGEANGWATATVPGGGVADEWGL
jgi:hypothetical protein